MYSMYSMFNGFSFPVISHSDPLMRAVTACVDVCNLVNHPWSLVVTHVYVIGLKANAAFCIFLLGKILHIGRFM